jgi:Asp-tRNA(Asn)/Glu-tRNA(Gln) amidotransferase A subunit family amidase
MTEATALHELTAAQAAELIRIRNVSPVELVEALLERARSIDGQVRAWETLDGERALAAARAAEKALREHPEGIGPLHGVPFGAKDIFDTADLRTSAGFAPFEKRLPYRDAEAVARLKRAGAILLGKTVTTQFAVMPPSKTRNPWAEDRTPGGSSSGSGAAIAAREVPLALGTQTNGSVLRPAAYNGVVGLKPTYGRVSKRGVFPVAWSLDHVGVLARSVDDCALFLTAAAGHYPEEAGSAAQVVPDLSVARLLQPPRFGLVRAALDRSTAEVATHLADVAQRFKAEGATVCEVQLEDTLETILAVHQVIMQTEAAEAHAQLLKRHPAAYDPRLRAYLEAGRLLPGVSYVRAQRLRRRIAADMERCCMDLDVLMLPTATDVAPGTETTGDRSLQTPSSLTGLPAVSLPSALSSERLPLAIQLIAPCWQEPRLLEVARWCESRLGRLPAPPV